MMEFSEAISWFQVKIGTYDKASWEKLVEEKELRIYEGLHYVKKKSGTVKPELIDVDLVRGSTFTKAKPIHTWGAITRKGLLRIIFFPFYYKWWQQQTTTRLWLWFLTLYILQVISITIYLHTPGTEFKDVTVTEVFGPAVLMIFLGSLHGQLVATNLSKKSSSPRRKLRNNRRRNSKSKKKEKNDSEELLNVSERHGIETIPLSSSSSSSEFTLRQRATHHHKHNTVQADMTELNETFEDIANPQITAVLDGEDKFCELLRNLQSEDYDKSATEKYGERGTEDELSENGDSTSSMSSSSEAEQMDMSEEDDDPFAFERKPDKVGETYSTRGPTAEKDAMKFNIDYLHFGIIFALVLAPLPLLFRVYNNNKINLESLSALPSEVLNFEMFAEVFGSTWRSKFVVVTAMIERLSLTFCFVFLLCVAERTFRQRFFYAKLFGSLTSLRKARRAGLPHFRLHKVRNIKTWLSLRSFLKKRGPQRSVEMIVSSSFLLAVFLAILMLTQLLKGSEKERFLHSMFNWEVSCWCLVLWLFELRFMTLGSKINRKYRNSKSVLLIEQVGQSLPSDGEISAQKEEFNIANNVLKLAVDLLKEVESPFKLSGISMSSHLYNITRVVVLSLFSGVMSDLLGFRLRGLKVLKLS